MKSVFILIIVLLSATLGHAQKISWRPQIVKQQDGQKTVSGVFELHNNTYNPILIDASANVFNAIRVGERLNLYPRWDSDSGVYVVDLLQRHPGRVAGNELARYPLVVSPGSTLRFIMSFRYIGKQAKSTIISIRYHSDLNFDYNRLIRSAALGQYYLDAPCNFTEMKFPGHQRFLTDGFIAPATVTYPLNIAVDSSSTVR